jgi:DNA-binding HxlR family transcriptional regulator
MKKSYNLSCNIAGSLDIIGDRWTLLIVRDLLNHIQKFNDLKQSLAGIAPNILSDRLQTLESAGIVKSALYSKHPPRYEYELTEKGRGLEHVINAIAIWGNQNLDSRFYDIVDEKCGHVVEISYYCPKCHKKTKTVEYKSIK